MVSVLIVQHVSVRWTKASRGGRGARQRAALLCPEPLPSGRQAEVVLHRIHHSEAPSGFESAREVMCGTLGETLTTASAAELSRPRESSTMRSVLWELGLALLEEEERLAVWSVPESYDVNGDGAFVAPTREWKRALLLERGCWGRLRINARRIGNWSGDWSYSESMSSISWHIDAPAHLFLGEPQRAYDARARLR